MKSKRLYLFYSLAAIAAVLVAIVTLLPLHEPMVGDVAPGSPASAAGFLFGDRIVAVGSRAIRSWEEFVLQIEAQGDGDASVTVQRMSGGEDILKAPVARGRVEGLSKEWRLPVLALRANSPLLRYGVATGDEVISVNGTPVLTWRDLEPVLTRQAAGAPLNMDVRTRSGRLLSLAVAPLGENYSSKSLGIDNPEFFVSNVKTASPAAKLGVQKYDRIYLVQGQPLSEEFQAKRLSDALKFEGKLQLDVIRGDQVIHLMTSKLGRNAELSGGVDAAFGFLGLVNLVRTASPAKSNVRQPLIWWQYKIGGKS